MDWLIRKRSGDIVSYQKQKIERAVDLALKSSDTLAVAADIADQVETALYLSFFKAGAIPTVDKILDLIEETFILRKLTAAAREFILYREKKSESRDVDDLLSGITSIIGDYIGRADWRVKENSNMNYSLQGLNFYISSSITQKYWISRIYTPRIRKFQEDGDFHIHDLGILGPYSPSLVFNTLPAERPVSQKRR